MAARPPFIAGLVVLLLAVACGGDDGGDRGGADGGDDRGSVTVDAVAVADRSRPGPDDDPTLLADPLLDLGVALLAETGAATGANVVLSPTSILTALGMLEPGAVGASRDQLRDLLGAEDPAAFHAAVNALAQSLESREGGDDGDVLVRLANAAHLQRGYPFDEAYLDTIGRHYGPVLNEVDFRADPDAVAAEIDQWVAEVTEDRITDLIGDGVLTEDTVLTLVNALYLNASWLTPFEPDDTEDAPFTTGDGGEVTVPFLHGRSDGSAAGDGWVGATKAYVGGLAAQFVLPDEGRFDEVAADPTEAFAALDGAEAGADLALPRFETRFSTSLADALAGLGVTAPFERPGTLTGIADDPDLVLSDVVHETYLAMDEEGVEAAAATAVVVDALSAPVGEPVPVVLDRPFLLRIVDQQTGATLFLGRITDPTT